jgi:hypothetical protein
MRTTYVVDFDSHQWNYRRLKGSVFSSWLRIVVPRVWRWIRIEPEARVARALRDLRTPRAHVLRNLCGLLPVFTRPQSGNLSLTVGIPMKT